MRRAKRHIQHVGTQRVACDTIHPIPWVQHVACDTLPATTPTQHVASLQTDVNQNVAVTLSRNTLRPYIFGRNVWNGWLFRTLCGLLLLLTVACQQEALENVGGGAGTLLLDGLRKQATQADSLLTKAIDNDLYVEIWQGEQQLYRYEPGQTPDQIALDTAAYRLKSYNAAALSTEVIGKGEAIFQLEKSFSITAGEINRLDAIVPMTNVGIRLDSELPDAFSGYQLTVQQGTRSETLAQGEVAFFKAGERLIYTLSAFNVDGEFRTHTAIEENPVAGTIYEINYALATKGDLLHE